MKKNSRFLRWKLRKLFDAEILIEINFIRIFWQCIYFYNCVFSLNSYENLQFFEYLRRNSYIQRSSKIFQNSEESSSSSSVHFPNPKILRLRLRSIFNLRCNTDIYKQKGLKCHWGILLGYNLFTWKQLRNGDGWVVPQYSDYPCKAHIFLEHMSPDCVQSYKQCWRWFCLSL